MAIEGIMQMVLRAMDDAGYNCLFVLFVSNFSERKGQLVFWESTTDTTIFYFEALKSKYNAYYFQRHNPKFLLAIL